jgi:predicted negative regulator of RcsB-dependent stress response
MGSRNYITIAVLIAAISWMAESLIHFFIYGEERFEVIPADFNEFCMRTLIAILIIGFGIYIAYRTTKQTEEIERGKRRYKETVKETNNKFSDFIEKVQNYDLEVRKTRSMDKDILNSFTDTIHEAKDQLAKLENAGDITAQNINPTYKSDSSKK